MLDATAEVMQRKGYANTSVAEIVSAAHISRVPFYKNFASKEHALLEAQRRATASVLSTCEVALATDQPWPTRIWQALGGVLELLASNPALSCLSLVECYAAGGEALRHVEHLPRLLAPYLQEGYDQRPSANRLPSICSEAITGALLEIIRHEVANRTAPRLLDRLSEFAYIALAPFIGPTAAAKTIERLSARQPS